MHPVEDLLQRVGAAKEIATDPYLQELVGESRRDAMYHLRQQWTAQCMGRVDIYRATEFKIKQDIEERIQNGAISEDEIKNLATTRLLLAATANGLDEAMALLNEESLWVPQMLREAVEKYDPSNNEHA